MVGGQSPAHVYRAPEVTSGGGHEAAGEAVRACDDHRATTVAVHRLDETEESERDRRIEAAPGGKIEVPSVSGHLPDPAFGEGEQRAGWVDCPPAACPQELVTHG